MRNKASNLIWGLLFIVVGIGFMGRSLWGWDFSIFFKGWWTLFIIVPCLTGLVRKGYNTGDAVGLGIGALLFLTSRDIISGSLVWKLFFPLIFVGIGLNILFRGVIGSKIGPQMRIDTSYDGQRPVGKREEYVGIFGGDNIRYPMEKFYGCNINAIFGGVDLDLTNAIIEDDIEIDITAIFGGVDVYVPNHVKVKVNNIPIFGGVGKKNIDSMDVNAPTIYVKSTCMFGGVDIK